MNDIDQRCDAYLAWLDNARRAHAPTIKEFGDAQSATTIIMQQAGMSAAPIAIAAAAFNFATNTYTNVTSRLVLELNRSTVQAVVLGRQRTYREGLFGTDTSGRKIMITSRPQAIFALRSYLRFCMPMTIETEVNSTVATFERGGAEALATSTPMITPETVAQPTLLTPSTRGPSYYRLRSLLFPKGQPDKAAAKEVADLLGEPRARGILNDRKFEPLYDRISACLVARSVGSPCPKGSLRKFR